jgi:hypothetical protein
MMESSGGDNPNLAEKLVNRWELKLADYPRVTYLRMYVLPLPQSRASRFIYHPPCSAHTSSASSTRALLPLM